MRARNAITLAALSVVALLSALPPTGASAAARRQSAEVRVDQVGFALQDSKRALVMSPGPERGARVRVLAAGGREVARVRLGRNLGGWNGRYRYVYEVEIPVRRSGRYRLVLDGPFPGSSPTFQIASSAALYGPLAGAAVNFFQAQRDGPNVVAGALHRQPSHLQDRLASIYSPPTYRGYALAGRLNRIGGPEDVSGGWFDAGDYLKFVESASFSDGMIELAALRYTDAAGPLGSALRAEARFGTDWLLKMWHQDTGALDGQVGIGDGNGTTVLGDHDFWRLPQADDALRTRPGAADYYVRYRPVFRFTAPGQPISPNLAGRLAAAFGLCSQLFRATDPAYANRCLLAGQTILDRAGSPNAGLRTTYPHAYYPESVSRDDLAWGAAELYLATAQAPGQAVPHPQPDDYYVASATTNTDILETSTQGGEDSLSLYQVAAIDDVELSRVLADVERRSPGHSDDFPVQRPNLVADLVDQLTAAQSFAAHDRFGLANPNGITDSVAHALGYMVTAGFYNELTGSRRFSLLQTRERDWVLGANAWGSSFMIGAGSVFPHCPQNQVANLAGSPNGHGALLFGATVAGPNDPGDFAGLGLPDGARACPANGRDPFAAFNGAGARYLDNTAAAASSEPSDDITALALAAFAQQSRG